jgi:hypothetical protein
LLSIVILPDAAAETGIVPASANSAVCLSALEEESPLNTVHVLAAVQPYKLAPGLAVVL